jgi:hypothetical protein
LPDPVTVTMPSDRMWISPGPICSQPGAGGSIARFLITGWYLFLAVVTKYSEVNAVFFLTSNVAVGAISWTLKPKRLIVEVARMFETLRPHPLLVLNQAARDPLWRPMGLLLLSYRFLRSALASIVRWRTSRSRVRFSITIAC